MIKSLKSKIQKHLNTYFANSTNDYILNIYLSFYI